MSAYLRAVALLICAGVALFASAGSFAIATFWVYLAILALVFVVAFTMLDRGLLPERMRPGGRPTPLGLRLLNVVLLAHWIVAGLDRGRLHWTDNVPLWLQALGLLLVAAGYALVFWAMRVNRFFSSVVRIQSDRGQHVVTSGPYAFVRHPGYSAGILIVLASGIALGSVARRGIPHRCCAAVPPLPRDPRGSRAAKPIERLCRLCAPCALEVGSRNLVIASRALYGAVKSAREYLIRIRDIMEQSH